MTTCMINPFLASQIQIHSVHYIIFNAKGFFFILDFSLVRFYQFSCTFYRTESEHSSCIKLSKFKLHVAILVTFLQFKLLVNLAILTLYQIIEITSMEEIEYLLTPFETPRAMNTCEPYLEWRWFCCSVRSKHTGLVGGFAGSQSTLIVRVCNLES